MTSSVRLPSVAFSNPPTASPVFAATDYPDRAARDEALGEWIESLQADLVVLAGYMQLLSAAFVARFRNRVVNIHPALLPAFPGVDAQAQAIGELKHLGRFSDPALQLAMSHTTNTTLINFSYQLLRPPQPASKFE